MSKVFIVVATWNSESYLSDLFHSLREMDYPKDSWNLVVVDNGSRDKSLEILRSWQIKMPNFLTIIQNEQNRGFAAGNNQGIKYALKNGAEYIALINDDVQVEPNWLNQVIATMEKDEKLGLVQPLITRHPEQNKINSFGNKLHYLGFGMSAGDGVKMKDYFENNKSENYEPAYVSFACVVIKKEIFEKIGLLDEKYFSYHEDSDFCLRARLQNYKMLVTKAAIVHHAYKFPTKKNKQRYFWMEKNRFYLVTKFYKRKTLVLLFPMFLMMEIGQGIFSIKNGFFRERAKAQWWWWRNLLSILKARKEIQRTRQLGDKELFEYMSGKIEFQELNNGLLKYIGNPILNSYFKFIKKFID